MSPAQPKRIVLSIETQVDLDAIKSIKSRHELYITYTTEPPSEDLVGGGSGRAETRSTTLYHQTIAVQEKANDVFKEVKSSFASGAKLVSRATTTIDGEKKVDEKTLLTKD